MKHTKVRPDGFVGLWDHPKEQGEEDKTIETYQELIGLLVCELALDYNNFAVEVTEPQKIIGADPRYGDTHDMGNYELLMKWSAFMDTSKRSGYYPYTMQELYMVCLGFVSGSNPIRDSREVKFNDKNYLWIQDGGLFKYELVKNVCFSCEKYKQKYVTGLCEACHQSVKED